MVYICNIPLLACEKNTQNQYETNELDETVPLVPISYRWNGYWTGYILSRFVC